MGKTVSRARMLWILPVVLAQTSIVRADVRVLVGPTVIPAGDARAPGDITVINEKLAFAIAVTSPVPYGVPRGAIIDLAPVQDGRIGRDRVVFADFIPNNWSAWPNTYRHVDILEHGPERVIIRSERDWGSVTISTLYTLKANSDRIDIQTTMSNRGSAALADLLSGLTLWPNSGFVFRVPGLADTEAGKADGALADRVVAYDEDWMVALHAPYLDHVAHGSLDLYGLHTLAAGATRQFEGWLQVGSSADLAPVVRAEIDRRQLAAGNVHGLVTGHNGRIIDRAIVVVEKQNKPYAWTVAYRGAYELTLPVGDYGLYATARKYSQTERALLTIRAGSDEIRNFHDLQGPGRIHCVISDDLDGRLLDARLDVTGGQSPVAGFLGRNRFFTELERKGHLDTELAPGHYVLTASSNGGFLGPSRQVDVDITSGKTQALAIALTRWFDPPARGWYSADLHHHADQAEAVTPPADLARSELAAGLDLPRDGDRSMPIPATRPAWSRAFSSFAGGVRRCTRATTP